MKENEPNSALEAIIEKETAPFINDTLLVGVSGGADSTALLCALLACRRHIMAVHCNFHLRGDESDADEAFVASLCNKLGVELKIVDFDVNDYVSTHKVSIEMACRDLRYNEFRKLKRDMKYARIVVAHNSGDNAETLMLNLMRGTGIAGLRGMLPDTGEILRPLLSVSRKEILDYLDEKAISYRIDSSNLSNAYNRNYVRNDIFPRLRERWQGMDMAISRTISNLLQEEKMLKYLERQFFEEDATELPYSVILQSPDAIWVIHRFIERFGGNLSQAEEIYRCISEPEFLSGKHWEVSEYNIYAERDKIEVLRRTGIAQNNEISVCSECFDNPESIQTMIRESNNESLWTSLSPDKILFRHAERGDRIEPLGMKGSMLVSKIMKGAKLSEQAKREVIVAIERESDKLIWVSGLKRSRHYTVSTDNRKVYCYRIKDYSATE